MERSDLWKMLVIGVILALAGGLVGGVLAIFATAGYSQPTFETLAASRLPRLKIDSRTDLLPFEVEGHLTQTTNLIEAQQYTETVVFSVDNDGNVMMLGELTVSNTVGTCLAGVSFDDVAATAEVIITDVITAGFSYVGLVEASDGTTVGQFDFIELNESATMFNDGTDVFTLCVKAAGVEVQRITGTMTFDGVLMGCWK